MNAKKWLLDLISKKNNKQPSILSVTDFLLIHYSKLNSYTHQQLKAMMYDYGQHVKHELTKKE